MYTANKSIDEIVQKGEDYFKKGKYKDAAYIYSIAIVSIKLIDGI